MTREVWTLLGMCACGAACSTLYDAFRAAHSLLKKHDITVMISDVIFWCMTSAIITLSLWYLNSGQLRGYEFIGLIVGAVLYFCTISRFLYKFFLTIDINCVKIFKSIYKMLLTLLSFLYKITVTPIYKGIRKLKSLTVKKNVKESEGKAV